MNLFRNNGRESIKNAQGAEPHAARRAVRYAAADNAQAALQRQFPSVSFMLANPGVQVSSQQVGGQAVQTNVGVQNDFAEAA